jgi:2-amino-4-hydroxy-6-hydroxymethyldihydropteridine diphosphokinase
MPPSEIVFIGLGANVGAARSSLTHAVGSVATLPGVTLVSVSRLYRTRPVGPVAQPDFLNAAALLRAPAGTAPPDGAMAMLIALKEIERTLGRVQRGRWGPREVDLDLLLFGEHRIHLVRDAGARSDDPRRLGVQWLEVPHPSAAQRMFVLAPLADLAPDLEPPGWGLNVDAALARAGALEGEDAVEAIATWDDTSAAWIDD